MSLIYPTNTWTYGEQIAGNSGAIWTPGVCSIPANWASIPDQLIVTFEDLNLLMVNSG